MEAHGFYYSMGSNMWIDLHGIKNHGKQASSRTVNNPWNLLLPSRFHGLLNPMIFAI